MSARKPPAPPTAPRSVPTAVSSPIRFDADRRVGKSEACPPFNATVSIDGGHGAGAPLPTLGQRASEAHVPSSLNLSATRPAIASIAACASGPIAETTTLVPGPAASIIRPMIEVPPTVSLPRVPDLGVEAFDHLDEFC